MGTEKENNVKLLRQIAAEKGVSGEGVAVLERIMKVESGGNKYEKVKKEIGSSAGLFGFIDGRWNDSVAQHPNELTKDGRSDARQQIIAAIYLTQDNEKTLSDKLGRNPTGGELYLAHFAGASGATAVLTATSDTKIDTLLSKKAMASNGYQDEKNKGIRLKTKDGELYFKDFTANDLKIWANRKMEQPDGYKTMTEDARAKYRKDHNVKDDAPDALGDMVMTVISNVVKIIASIGSGLGNMFSGDSPSGNNPPSPPATPASKIASSKSPSPSVG